MIILEPRGEWKGLCLELKKEGTAIKTGKGSFLKGQIEEQAKTLDRLLKKGYAAFFAVGFDKAKAIIDDYMKLPIVRANASDWLIERFNRGLMEVMHGNSL